MNELCVHLHGSSNGGLRRIHKISERTVCFGLAERGMASLLLSGFVSSPELEAREAVRGRGVPIIPRLTLSPHLKISKRRSHERNSHGTCMLLRKFGRSDITEKFCSPHGVVTVNSREFGNVHFTMHSGKEDIYSFDEVIFEDGIFEDAEEVPFLDEVVEQPQSELGSGNLIPDDWRSFQVEINETKTEKRKQLLRQQLENAEKKQSKYRLLREKVETREMHGDFAGSASRLAGAPVTATLGVGDVGNDSSLNETRINSTFLSQRATPRNPRLELGEITFEDISRKFQGNTFTEQQVQTSQNLKRKEQEHSDHRRLFTVEEKMLLRRKGPELDKLCSGKWPLLHTLATSGQVFLLVKLLQQDIDIDLIDKDGMTALQKAVLCKKEVVVSQLLRAGANANVCDKDGATLLHYTVQTAASNLVKLLIRHGVDVNSRDGQGWTPLHLAVQTGRADMVKLLLMNGADQSLKNNDGLTPLDLCLAFGRGFNSYEVSKALKKFLKGSLEANEHLRKPLDLRLP